MLLELPLQERFEEVPHALMIVGINGVVPLLEPWHQRCQAGE
jgi:hypothetical protein